MIKHTGITSTSTFLQGLFLRCPLEVLNSIVSLQPSLQVSLQDDILRHFYRGISMVMSLRSSLLISLRSGFLRVSLLASLRSEFLQSSLLTSLRNIFLRRLYRDISLRSSLYRQNLKCFCRVYNQNLKYFYKAFLNLQFYLNK